MRTLVLGAGTVGSSVSEMLCRYGHHVIVVDDVAERTRAISETHDVGVVTGSASESPVLFQAGVFDTDLCLAVTGSDEVNLIAASLSKAMGCKRAVARVFAPAYLDLSTFDYQRHFGLDRLLSLEHLSAMEFACGIRHPGALTVENLARGEIEVQQLRVEDGARGVGTPLKSLKLPKEVRIGAITREGRTSIAGAEDILQVNDQISLIGKRGAIDDIRKLFQKNKVPIRKIVIAGGGETGFNLARVLEDLRFSVVVMEEDADRCDFLASHLKHATVVQVDATRRSVLEEERVGTADTFVACLGVDEENVMAGVEAREIGAETIMAIVSRPDYASVLGKLGIDLAVSPREVMANQILCFLTTGPVVSRSQLGNSSISVMELDVLETAAVTKQPLSRLALPSQSLIAAIARLDYVKVPGGDDQLSPGDTAVALVAQSAMDDLVKLFRAT